VYHFTRKSYTNIRKELVNIAGVPVHELNLLDTVFMTSYSLGSFGSGMLGDRLKPSSMISMGLLGTAMCNVVLIEGLLTKILQPVSWQIVFFTALLWGMNGMFQSAGGPNATAIMGNWFGSKNRGLVFGLWTCHQYIGNIVSALVATVLVTEGFPYWWGMIGSAMFAVAWSVVCMFCVPSHPGEIHSSMPTLLKREQALEQGSALGPEASPLEYDEQVPISFIETFRLPGVILYAVAFGLLKFSDYVIFFWLPYILSSRFTPEKSNWMSAFFDFGMMPGGIIVGYVSDLLGGKRALVCAGCLVCLFPLILSFGKYSEELHPVALVVLLFLAGNLIGGPNNIITSAVAADLADHSTIKGNKRALGAVTGIINGSGGLIASIGLSAIGPLQSVFGWNAVWFLVAGCVLLCIICLLPIIYRECLTRAVVQM